MQDNEANFNLVPTKLNRPAIDSRWISRPRLLSVLDGALRRKLTLISAPAGYGKTTLAAQWLDHIAQPSAWLSLDEHDSDPERFLRYMTASIRKIFPQFGPQIGPLLSSPTPPPLEYLADILISDLAALAKTLVLVFDDFHNVESKPVQTMIDRLIRYLPDQVHLVIATRVDPPLPLARWRMRNWLSELRAADLRFFTEETKVYFASSFAEKLPDNIIDQILSRTEGWVAGLQLSRLSLADADNPEAFVRSFSGSDRMVAEYLMDEVISRQPDEIKHFFAVTSMLERFCAPLCDHLLSKGSSLPDSRKLIAFLEKENLFLVPLDNEGTWYRYHHLFQTMLILQMRSDLPKNGQTRIHLRAGEWFAGRGYIEDALRHLIAAEDLDAAAELVEENMHALIDRDLSRRSLKQWLDMFPNGAEKQQPTLLVAHAFQKMFRWDLAGMVSLLDKAEFLLKDPACEIPKTRRQSLLGDIDVQRAFYLYWQGNAESALRYARQGLRIVPKKHRYIHSLSIMYTVGGYTLCGRMDDALHLLDKSLEVDCSEGSPNAGHLLMTKATVFVYAADLDKVIENAKKILTTHNTVPQPDYWVGYAHYYLGSMAYERNLLDAAADHFGRVEQMRYRVTTRMYQDALIGLMLVALVNEDTDRAEEYAAMAYAFAIEVNDPISLRMSDSIQIRKAMISGKVSADPAPYRPTIDSNQFWLEIPSLTYAEYLVNKVNHRDCSAGLEFVEKCLQMARHHHNTRLEIQFLAVKAIALKCAGRLNLAIESLENTLKLAEPRGFVRSFVDRGPLMAELLKALSANRPENQYATSLLCAFGDRVPSKNASAPALEDPARTKQSADDFASSGLSNRELDVLILLQERLTNKEIAQRLFLSPETVKTHISRIYRKLGVNNRRRAVAVSRQRNLLPERRRH